MRDAAGAAIALGIILAGCSADTPLNPSFPLRLDDARDLWASMTDEPRPFERPVLVLGGINDLGFGASSMAHRLRQVTTEQAVILDVSFLRKGTLDACRQSAIEAVEHALPALDPDATVEVDVVAISMGGLVARHAARPHPDQRRRLRVRRLFTIATPHRGARLATLPTLDQRVLDMRPGSDFLDRLDGSGLAYEPEIFPYVRLDDAVIGPEHAAPPGMNPWWVPNIPFSFAHIRAAGDPRILVDIARRLRGQTPYSTTPAAPLPTTRK